MNKFKLNLKLLIMMIMPLIVALQQYNHQVRCCIKSENVIVKQKQKSESVNIVHSCLL